MKIFLVNPKCCDNNSVNSKYNGLRFLNGITVTMKNGQQCTCDENGGCVETCTDTCESLGYECGTHMICGVSEICPDNCGGDEECHSGRCCHEVCNEECHTGADGNLVCEDVCNIHCP